jgi:phage repressor protein C with HTH and peptisase S24 domain
MRRADQELHTATVDWINKTVERGYPHITALSEAAGVPQSSLSRLLQRPEYVLSASSLRKIAQVSEAPIPQVVKNLLDRTPGKVQERPKNMPGYKQGIPLWGCHLVSRDGEFRLNPVSLQSMQRPIGMAASDKVVAFYAPDDSMSPRWDAGEIVLIDLMRSAKPGDYALVTLLATQESPNETETAYLRRLEGRNGGRLHLSALSPDLPPLSFPIERVAEVRRALTWNDVFR